MKGPLAALNVDWSGSEAAEVPYALYFFGQRQYIRWNIDEEHLFDGYPKEIADGWPGLLDTFPGAQLSGAMHVPDWNNRIWFFFRDQDAALGWDIVHHRPDPKPTPLSELLPTRLCAPGPFAPVYMDRGESRMVYVFRGDEYTRFTTQKDRFPTHEDDGYPRKIGDGWTGGLTVAPTCAVSVRWTHRSSATASHKLYFFLGDLYTRWDIASHSNNYRLDIPTGWKGWPAFE